MVTNYERGANKERYIKNKLEKAGYLVVRSSGSHTKIDLVAINPDGTILFLQIKPKKFSQKQIDKLEKECAWLNRTFIGKFRVISKWKNG